MAGREKDIGYLHVHSVLELERGQVSLPYGVIAVREGETLRLLRQAEPFMGIGELCFAAGRLAIPAEKFMVSDAVIGALFEADD